MLYTGESESYARSGNYCGNIKVEFFIKNNILHGFYIIDNIVHRMGFYTAADEMIIWSFSFICAK